MPASDRFHAEGAALIVVDVQSRLMERIVGREGIERRALLAIRAARLMDLPLFATEQYPKGLGPTVPELATLLPDRRAKLTFGLSGLPDLLGDLEARGIRHIALVGVEAHICVAEAALDLLDRRFRVQILADAVGSRSVEDRSIALRRLERAGAVVTTVEAAIFAWLGLAEHPRFKAISGLVKDADQDATQP